MSDEKCLKLFGELLATRIQLGTAYISSKETGLLTHQLLVIKCGEMEVQSVPELLAVPLMPVIPDNVTAH